MYYLFALTLRCLLLLMLIHSLTAMSGRLLLLIVLFAIGPPLLLPTHGSSFLYKDPLASVEDRVEDLLSRMSLEEKIGQMVQIDRTAANTSVIQHFLVGITVISIYLSIYIYAFISKALCIYMIMSCFCDVLDNSLANSAVIRKHYLWAR